MVKIQVKDHIPVEVKALNTGDLFVIETDRQNINAPVFMVLDIDDIYGDTLEKIMCVMLTGEEVGRCEGLSRDSKVFCMEVVSEMIVRLE